RRPPPAPCAGPKSAARRTTCARGVGRACGTAASVSAAPPAGPTARAGRARYVGRTAGRPREPRATLTGGWRPGGCICIGRSAPLRPGTLAVHPLHGHVQHDTVGDVPHRVPLARADVMVGEPVHHLESTTLGDPVDPALNHGVRPQPLARVLLRLE